MTDEDEGKVKAFLSGPAPVTTGFGADAVKTAKAVAWKLFPHFTSIGHGAPEFRLMEQYWSPRCDPPWDNEALFLLIMDARPEYDAHVEASERDKAREEREAEEAELAAAREEEEAAAEVSDAIRAKRDARATKIRKIKDAIGCSARYARMLYAEGTSSPERARQLADILGTAPKEHLRPKLKSGREPDLVAMLMKAKPSGTSFRDFAMDAPELGDPSSTDLLSRFRKDYRSASEDSVEDFESFEELVDYARSLNGSTGVEAARAVWDAFKIWHIELVCAIARYSVEDGS